MLQLSKMFLNQPVMSLRTGGQVGTVVRPIINPNNLKIEGWFCQDRFSKDTLILQTTDVREVIPQGFVVDDHEVLSPAADLVRLKELLEINFEIMEKPVITVSKERLGKVGDYAVEPSSMYIQKLYIEQNILKSFSGGGLSVDRNQIVEITDNKIIIQDPLQGLKSKAVPATAPAS